MTEKLEWLETLSRTAPPRDRPCVEWPWARSAKGYGDVSHDGRVQRAGHVMLELTGQSRPAGAQQLHSCDNPPCVAPWHLSWGTNLENRTESVDRGRHSRGEGRPAAKLTEQAVREIRSSTEMLKVLAERYGVGVPTIWKARTGETWRHVPMEATTNPSGF